MSSRLIIVCPMTSSGKDRPYFVDIQHEKLKVGNKVNTKQLYTID
ncbi:type II toxin-antitoxin system PemK/MazF family toxin [Enterococcus sp.]|nr:type II toxin-antitoxin system PemK/MazF family toxin [Enterococcus sp.]